MSVSRRVFFWFSTVPGPLSPLRPCVKSDNYRCLPRCRCPGGFFFGSALSRGRNRHLGHVSKATTIAACLGAASVLVSEMRTAPRKCNNRPLIATSADPCPDTRHSKANIWLSHTPVTAVGFFDARALALTADPCKKQGFVRMQHPCFCFISETVGLKS